MNDLYLLSRPFLPHIRYRLRHLTDGCFHPRDGRNDWSIYGVIKMGAQYTCLQVFIEQLSRREKKTKVGKRRGGELGGNLVQNNCKGSRRYHGENSVRVSLTRSESWRNEWCNWEVEGDKIWCAWHDTEHHQNVCRRRECWREWCDDNIFSGTRARP